MHALLPWGGLMGHGGATGQGKSTGGASERGLTMVQVMHAPPVLLLCPLQGAMACSIGPYTYVGALFSGLCTGINKQVHTEYTTDTVEASARSYKRLGKSMRTLTSFENGDAFALEERYGMV